MWSSNFRIHQDHLLWCLVGVPFQELVQIKQPNWIAPDREWPKRVGPCDWQNAPYPNVSSVGYGMAYNYDMPKMKILNNWGGSWNRGTPKSSIWIGFSFWGSQKSPASSIGTPCSPCLESPMLLWDVAQTLPNLSCKVLLGSRGQGFLNWKNDEKRRKMDFSWFFLLERWLKRWMFLGWFWAPIFWTYRNPKWWISNDDENLPPTLQVLILLPFIIQAGEECNLCRKIDLQKIPLAASGVWFL